MTHISGCLAYYLHIKIFCKAETHVKAVIGQIQNKMERLDGIGNSF